MPDLHPVLPGHTLVVPKRHVEGIADLSAEELSDLGLILRKLLPKLLEEHGTDSYNLAINKGKVAGMLIPHMHVHVIPRHGSDSFQKEGVRALYDAVGKESSATSGDFKGNVTRLRKLFKYEIRPSRERKAARKE